MMSSMMTLEVHFGRLHESFALASQSHFSLADICNYKVIHSVAPRRSQQNELLAYPTQPGNAPSVNNCCINLNI